MIARLMGAAAILAVSMSAAMSARTDLVVGVVLEPPHLDPTAGAAAAIDEIVYANVFEGLTRIGPNGEVLPPLPPTGPFPTTARATHSSFART